MGPREGQGSQGPASLTRPKQSGAEGHHQAVAGYVRQARIYFELWWVLTPAPDQGRQAD